MKDFRNKLEKLEKLYQQEFESFEYEEDEDAYVKIRTDVLDLLATAKKELSGSELADFKTLVIDFFCENSGCALDLEILQRYTPEVLSKEDLEHIKHNSALARWL